MERAGMLLADLPPRLRSRTKSWNIRVRTLSALYECADAITSILGRTGYVSGEQDHPGTDLVGFARRVQLHTDIRMEYPGRCSRI
jgi:hypothetical protein